MLLDPSRWQGRAMVKVTLLVLLARGKVRLEVEPRRGILHPRRVVMHAGAPRSLAVGRDEGVLFDTISSDLRTGATMTLLVKRLRMKFGADLNRFDRDLVRPWLIGRGLLTEAYRPVLWVFRRRSDKLTDAGLAEQRRLRAAMDQARRIPGVLGADAAAAAALAAGAGVALFLVPELKAQYGRLGVALRDHGNNAGGDGSTWDFGSWDFTSLDNSGIDDSAFDAFDDAMSAFDSDFDGAADGDGGDGGDGGC